MKVLGVTTAAAIVLGALLASEAATGTEPRALLVEGRTNATPSVAAEGRVVVVAWSAAVPKGGTDIYIAASRDAGRTFSPPVRVNDEVGAASASGEQPPRVALVARAGGEPSVVVVWTAKSSSGTRIMTARSEDGGKTFSRSRVLSGDAPGNRGWESIVTGRDGRVGVVWLDHRELVATGTPSMPMNHDMHAHPSEVDGTAKAQLSKLYFANADGSGARAIAAGVCYCCKTGIAAGPDGSLYAVWRHVYPGNIRDIAFAVSRDGGKSFAAPIRVSEDKWMLNGCPENGPAVAVQDQRVHVVWPTLVPGVGNAEPELALFHATTRDGRAFTPRQRVPTEGAPRHPQIATAANGMLWAAWDEGMGGGRHVVLARAAATPSGALRFSREPIGHGPLDEYPVVAATRDGAVVAWVSRTGERSTIRVQPVAP